MADSKGNPVSFRLTDEGREAIKECEQLSGLKRSAVIELAVRELRDRLRRSAVESSPKKKRKPPGGA